jgi:hypothetical protein
MNGIYFKDGIYVTIDDGKTKNDICVYNFHKNDVSLYGGRIRITRWGEDTAQLYVDGKSIIEVSDKEISGKLFLSEIVSHLNAIQTNGVDAFIEQYKKSIEFLYAELKESNQRAESLLSIEHDEQKLKNLLSELVNLRNLLFSVLAILFGLNNYMSAGLENEKVISTCQSIMDSLA